MTHKSQIRSYAMNRLQIPAGRMIGDKGCAYDEFDLVVVRLTSGDDLVGWGYGECVWKGQFRDPAWWIQPGASLDELEQIFAKHWWPHLKDRNPFETRLARRQCETDQKWLDSAVCMALWDLMAKQVDLPLSKMLGGNADRIKAYGSLLDFPLDEAQAVALAQKFVRRGFKILKVKVGAPNVDRDIQRLRAIRKAVGDDIELTADANLAWDAQTTIERLDAFNEAGITLAYLEDPIPHQRIAEYAALAGRTAVPIIGHDYIANSSEMAALLQTGALKKVRPGADIDRTLAIAELAEQFGTPLVFGNSLLEINVHPACGLANVDRMEFSDLAWNDLAVHPVQFKDGFGYAPTAPGHGLELRADALEEYHQPQARSDEQHTTGAE